MAEATVLSTADGELLLTPTGDNRLKLVARPNSADYFVSRREIVTNYSPELVKRILGVKGLDYVCDEIARDEDPKYVSFDFEMGLFAFVPKEAFSGKRLLDFGCGSGASTMALRRMLPKTEIVGVELEEDLLSIARARAAFYEFPDLTLRKSPSGTELPPDIGSFDFVVLHAVFEHLLPEERKIVLPLIWRVLRPGASCSSTPRPIVTAPSRRIRPACRS